MVYRDHYKELLESADCTLRIRDASVSLQAQIAEAANVLAFR